ncbi:hypothetical protein LZ31DRAFT_151137 [Colletotrichum somersetense]|nr:hypothetical protein LZ31DRAFT_151137 [Colletotrichum somersetense]
MSRIIHFASSYFLGLTALPHRSLRLSCHGSTAGARLLTRPERVIHEASKQWPTPPMYAMPSLQGGHTHAEHPIIICPVAAGSPGCFI